MYIYFSKLKVYYLMAQKFREDLGASWMQLKTKGMDWRSAEEDNEEYLLKTTRRKEDEDLRKGDPTNFSANLILLSVFTYMAFHFFKWVLVCIMVSPSLTFGSARDNLEFSMQLCKEEDCLFLFKFASRSQLLVRMSPWAGLSHTTSSLRFSNGYWAFNLWGVENWLQPSARFCK